MDESNPPATLSNLVFEHDSIDEPSFEVLDLPNEDNETQCQQNPVPSHQRLSPVSFQLTSQADQNKSVLSPAGYAGSVNTDYLHEMTLSTSYGNACTQDDLRFSRQQNSALFLDIKSPGSVVCCDLNHAALSGNACPYHHSMSSILRLNSPTLDSESSGSLSSSTLNHDEVLKKIVEENKTLKENLNQNNMALKQYKTLFMHWEEVSKVYQSQKEKFQETRDFVLKLKEEKAEMRKKIVELSKALEKQTQALQKTKEGSTSTETSLSNLVEQLTAELSSATTTLKEKDDNLTLVKEELLALREENKLVKDRLEDRKSVELHSNEYQQEQVRGFSFRVDELTAKLLAAEQELLVERQELLKLKEMLAMRGVSPARDETSERSDAVGNHEQLMEQAREINLLKGKVVSLEQMNAEMLVSKSEAELTQQRLRERIDTMNGIIVESDDKVNNLEHELESLKSTITILNKENEAIPILKAQVDVYQSDFLMEREARERVVAEKEQLAEELRRYRRNEDSQQQSSVPTSSEERGPDVGDEDPVPPPRRYYCPKCTMEFQRYDILDLHVDRCLNLVW